MQIPPFFDHFDDIGNGTLLAASVSAFLDAIVLEAGVNAIRVDHSWLISAIPEEYNVGLEVLLVDVSVLCTDAIEGDEAIGIGIVDGDPVLVRGAVDGEQVVEINKVEAQVQFVVHD
jgi:hypothetical protein